MSFKSGFVTIIGKPNSGKSTLLNAMLGEKISIITSKAQTTRHRIKGILTTENYQVVFSDTPGVIDPKYGLHKSMMKAVSDSLEDADLVIFLFDATGELNEIEEIASRFQNITTPSIVAINKSDAADENKIAEVSDVAKKYFPTSKAISISALQKINLDLLLQEIISMLPEQPAFFSEDELTDKSERFIVSELIREKIFEQFHQEIPYSTEVAIHEWKEEKDITKIRADIMVERESQKAILLGKGGTASLFIDGKLAARRTGITIAPGRGAPVPGPRLPAAPGRPEAGSPPRSTRSSTDFRLGSPGAGPPLGS
jgi:GTP-binding protein Era